MLPGKYKATHLVEVENPFLESVEVVDDLCEIIEKVANKMAHNSTDLISLHFQ